jgi:anti-sigma regulatory factor (Ser/Thr protein kinase)
MMEELDMHILDLVQNALTAKAETIEVACICQDNQLTLRVADDGVGMDAEVLQAVKEGFFSTKSERSVGLGIPFLRQTAEQCDGSFTIDSVPGKGTTVTATFRKDHVDLPPFGNLQATFLSILATSRGRRVKIDYKCDGKELSIDTAEVMDILGGVPIDHPMVIAFLKDYIAERLGGDDEARRSTQD